MNFPMRTVFFILPPSVLLKNFLYQRNVFDIEIRMTEKFWQKII